MPPKLRPSLLLPLLIAVPAAAWALTARNAPMGPGESGLGDTRLVVVVAVDQLRPDMLEHYAPSFTGGLARLMSSGAFFVEGTHDHANTETAAGHATIATGVHPARHGIVANEWRDLSEGSGSPSVYSVEDPDAPVLGLPEAEGRSPRNLLRDGLADWVLDADPGARVVSIARKDRSAVTLGGRNPSAYVYWIDVDTALFVTSTYYRDQDPEWVARFNRERMPALFGEMVWESTVPASVAHLSREDTFAAEGNARTTAFPHRAAEEVREPTPRRLHAWRIETPVPDRAVAELAAEAVRALGLGRRGSVDLLALSFSQTDAVGHAYGPWSREQLDNLLRLDRELGNLFDLLDAEVGAGGWLLALSSDHGVLPVPEDAERAPPGARRHTREERQAMGRAIQEAREAGAGTGAGAAENEATARVVADALEALPFVADVLTFDELEANAPPADSFAVLFRNSHRPDRTGSSRWRDRVYVRLQEGILSRSGTGTSHGTVYLYDRIVPILFFGPGIDPGIRRGRAATVDVAPTLATLAGIPFPEDLDGRVLIERR